MLTLQFSSTFTDEMRKIFDIVSSGDTKAADEIFGSNLHITVSIVKCWDLILGPAEVAVAGDSRSTIELAETFLSFRLSGGIVSIPSKEFIGGDTLLVTESGPVLVEFRFCVECQ
jgi:hypothetical protein